MNIQTRNEPFSLRRRNLKGATPTLQGWGFANETDRLTDVLLGSPRFLRHMATSSLSRKHLRENPCNIQVAQAQHKDLMAAYEHFGVKVHMVEPEPELEPEPDSQRHGHIQSRSWSQSRSSKHQVGNIFQF